jgi:hypothetical protein
MTALVTDIYDRSRLQCLREMSLGYRALAFWKGEPYAGMAELVAAKSKVINYQTLQDARSALKREIISHLEGAFSPQQRFPAPDKDVAPTQ